ncbi:hypothetical protein TRICI_000134 [Trichomonascus ciferrii]|uniref:DEK-C domain-containing protein n=1 Tax=Trichomonascus ciferrii TaxID=44093 RepID=A0A642VE79_9ASCO|nr:hypothetical protein TRICI_000134 [Trichomonascus ciferrii]
MRLVINEFFFSTVMLPSVVVYLGYLIYKIASHDGSLPIISIILIAAVYGLQMLVFILRRQWQHIGWMIIYILAYPVHGFLLPIYSFWNMDNFSWGNTRVVVDMKDGRQQVLEAKDKTQLEGEPEDYVKFETWEAYAVRNGLPGSERPIIFDDRKGKLINQAYDDANGYDMQELTPYGKSIYDDQMTMRTGTLQGGIGIGGEASGAGGMSLYSTPREDYRQSRPFSGFSVDMNRASTPMSGYTGGRPGQFGAIPANRVSQRLSYLGLSPSEPQLGSPYANNEDVPPVPQLSDPYEGTRDQAIQETIRQVLQEADLENMTKRQLREKVEDILGVEFTGERLFTVDRLIDEELERMEDEEEADSQPLRQSPEAESNYENTPDARGSSSPSLIEREDAQPHNQHNTTVNTQHDEDMK